MTKRELALEHIRIEVATEGKITARAIGFYTENRVSYAAFMEAADRGMTQWRALRARDSNGADSHPA